jgi:hypothetical protein
MTPVFITKSVPSNISYKSFKTYNLPTQNSYCDHRNFDCVNQTQSFIWRKVSFRVNISARGLPQSAILSCLHSNRSLRYSE